MRFIAFLVLIVALIDSSCLIRSAKKIDASLLFVSQRDEVFVNVVLFLYTLNIKALIECVNSGEWIFVHLNSA